MRVLMVAIMLRNLLDAHCQTDRMTSPGWNRVCFLMQFKNSLLASYDFCSLPLLTIWIQIRPVKTSGLIWIKTVCHTDHFHEFWDKSVDDKTL